MSAGKFCGLIGSATLNEADKKWFPRWIRSYASSLKISKGDLRVTEADVIEFSKLLRDTKTPAWQRLQAVRAIEAYRNLVLKTEEPSLQHVRQTLSSIAAKEKADGPGADRPGIEDERRLIAWIETGGMGRWERGPGRHRHDVITERERRKSHPGSCDSP